MELTDEQLAKLNNITDTVPPHKSPPRDAAATPDLPRRPDPLGALGMAEHDPESPFPYSHVGGANPDPSRRDPDTRPRPPEHRGNLGPSADYEFSKLGGANPHPRKGGFTK